MKSFISSSVIKSTTVEIISPKLVHSIERNIQKQTVLKGLAVSENSVMPKSEHDLPNYRSMSLQLETDYKSPVNSVEQEEISVLLLQAKKEAEHLVAEAQKEAKLILQAARDETDMLRDDLEASIREEVMSLAYAEGYQKGIKEAEEEAVKITKQAKNYLQLAQTALMDEFHRVDKELLSLCMKISERIIHSTLSLEPCRLLHIIRNLTLMPREKKNLKIHISKEDGEWFKKIAEEDKPPYPVIIDESLRAGDSFLECQEGIFDGRIDSQLDKVQQFLLEELGNGELDGTSQEV